MGNLLKVFYTGLFTVHEDYSEHWTMFCLGAIGPVWAPKNHDTREILIFTTLQLYNSKSWNSIMVILCAIILIFIEQKIINKQKNSLQKGVLFCKGRPNLSGLNMTS